MTTTKKTDTELAWLLDQLIAEVPGIETLIVLAKDGLIMAASSGTSRDQADKLAAAASGLLALARRSGGDNAGQLRHIIAEYDRGYLWIMGAGDNAALAVQAADVDPGTLGFELQRLVNSVGNLLATSARGTT